MSQGVLYPDIRWILAVAAILASGTRLAMARQILRAGVAVAGTDRAERSEDPANFWTIVCLYVAPALLFSAVGIFMIVKLVEDHVLPNVPFYLSMAWAVLILAGQRGFWKEYEGGLETRAQRFMRVAFGLSALLAILALLACFCGMIAFRFVPASPVPTPALSHLIEYDGTKYVSAGSAASFTVLNYLWSVTPLPTFALGYWVWLERFRTRRVRVS